MERGYLTDTREIPEKSRYYLLLKAQTRRGILDSPAIFHVENVFQMTGYFRLLHKVDCRRYGKIYK